MARKYAVLMGLVALIAITSSCIFDPEKKDDPVVPPTPYQNLTEPWHVLNNLQKAYNDRNVTRYDELLDDNFTFFFADGDVGGDIPEQWGRAEELGTATTMFSRSQVGDFPLARSIRVDVLFEGQTQWVELIPDAAPDETWLTTTLFYDFTIEVEPDLTLVPYNGAKCQFTVRNEGTVDAPRWQLVEWRDLGASN